MENETQVNIVVATYNRWEYTEDCIPNIRETASDSIPFTITVVDNGSSDGTPEKLKKFLDDGIIDHLVLLKKNIGVAKAQNIGWLLQPKAQFYGKIDNDVLFRKNGWLDDIMTIFNHTKKIGALGYQCSGDSTTYPTVRENGVYYNEKNGNIGGACFFVPKKISDELGHWNEGYGKYGEEDADYGMRITVSGYKNCYMVDRNVMTHLPEQDAEYRKFKDDEREDNFKKGFWTIINEYKTNRRSLKIESNILDDLGDINIYERTKNLK